MFMLLTAALLAPLTAVLGFIYSYAELYSGQMATLLLWLMWLGIMTAILTIAIAWMREKKGISKLYYIALVILVFMLNVTAVFGGEMTFGGLLF